MGQTAEPGLAPFGTWRECHPGGEVLSWRFAQPWFSDSVVSHRATALYERLGKAPMRAPRAMNMGLWAECYNN